MTNMLADCHSRILLFVFWSITYCVSVVRLNFPVRHFVPNCPPLTRDRVPNMPSLQTANSLTRYVGRLRHLNSYIVICFDGNVSIFRREKNKFSVCCGDNKICVRLTSDTTKRCETSALICGRPITLTHPAFLLTRLSPLRTSRNNESLQ